MKKTAFTLAFWVLAAPAFAQTTENTSKRVDATHPEAIIAVLQDMGYRATLGKDKLGDPKIDSAASGSKFGILFYNCEKNVDCRSIQFFSGFDMENGSTLELMNEWNANKRFSKAYLDEEKDPYLELDLNLDFGGVSEESFRDTVETWEQLVAQFKDHIDW